MRLGIDLDGVVVDWVGSVLRELGCPAAAVAVTEWDSIFDVTGMKPSELFAFCKRAGVFMKADPVEGAIDGLEALFAAGHDVQFVTSRPEWARAETYSWLSRHLRMPVPDLEQMTYIIQGTNKSVAKCDLYLDDSPHVLKDLRKRRCCVVRYERPWNKNSKSWRFSVADWPAFVSLIGCLS